MLKYRPPACSVFRHLWAVDVKTMVLKVYHSFLASGYFESKKPPSGWCLRAAILVVLSMSGCRNSDPSGAAQTITTSPVAPLVQLGYPPEGKILVVRDTYGVPHIYGATGEDVAYGAGYAQAQDRLWEMYVIRLIATGNLSELLGPVASPADRDLRFFTYTKEERARQFETFPPRIQSLIQAYVDGVNAWIAEVHADPENKLPMEFATFQIGMPPDWAVDYTLALGSLLTYSIGAAGGSGNELDLAAVLQDLIGRYGEQRGLAMFNDIAPGNDPDAIPSVPPEVSYRNTPTFARDAEVEANRSLTEDARLSIAKSATVPKHAGRVASAAKPAIGTLAQLALIPDMNKAKEGLAAIQRGRAVMRQFFKFGSTAQIVGPQRSATGNSLASSGSQVEWFVPSPHHELGLHSADGVLDTVGTTIPGLGPNVFFGSGKGYFFTGTVGFSDDIDTFVVKLGPTPRSYIFNGQVEQMDCRTETYSFHGVPFETQEICRTRHGPVVAFDEANGVAYAYRCAWFDREVQSTKTLYGWQSARSIEDFATATNLFPSSSNYLYADDQGNYGYWHTANHPVRAPGVDRRLPQDGSGGAEWRGILPIQETPHAVNFERGWTANWNNLPAAGWVAERGFTPVKNVNSLFHAMDPAQTKPDPNGGLVNADGLFDFEDISATLRYAAYKHHPDTYYRPFLPTPEMLASDLSRKALATILTWDGFDNDLDGDDFYHAGRTIVDAWIVNMRQGAFRDEFPLNADGTENPSWWVVMDRYATGGMLWHVLNTQDRLRYQYDWLNGEDPVRLAARAFDSATVALATQFQSQDPVTWRTAVVKTVYTNLTPAFYTETASGGQLSGDEGVPGDAPSHIFMDRGTTNLIASYLTPPSRAGVLGAASREAGTVVPPGQNGFVNLRGVEGPHFQDQHDNYVNWKYKPSPMTLAEARAVAESEVTLTRPAASSMAALQTPPITATRLERLAAFFSR